MTSLSFLPLNPTAARLIGTVGLVAATSLHSRGEPHALVGIVAPGFDHGDEWVVVHQIGTSPQDPAAGTSSIQGFETLEEALIEFDEIVMDPELTVDLPFYVVVAPKLRGGRPLYVQNDRFAGGAGFTDHVSFAAVNWSAKSAEGAVNGARHMKTYHRADTVDFDALHVQQGSFQTRRVDLSSVPADRIAQQGKDSKAPDGWSYVVADERVAMFLWPERLGDDMGAADAALPFKDLAEAHAAALEQNAQVALLRRVVDGQALTADMLAGMTAQEEAILHPEGATTVTPVKELRDISVYRPFSVS